MSVGLRAGGSAPGRSPGKARLRRLSIGHFAVGVAAVLAFVANLAFLRSQDDSTPVVVAAREIAAGEAVAVGDLTLTRVRAEAGILSTLLTSVEGVEGRVAARPITAGELVGTSDLLDQAAPGGLASMAVPIDPAHAAGGLIRVGDRVDVVDVGKDGAAVYVVRDAPVLSVADEGTAALAGTGGGRHLVVGLDDEQVLAVARAIADGQVDVVVTTGTGDG